MDNIVIIGSAGHAKVIIDIVERDGRYKIAGLLDLDRKVGEQTLGYRILGREEDLPHLATTHAVKGVIVAIGDNYVRSKVAARAKEACPTLLFATAIHPRASVARDVSVGEGTVLMAGVTVNTCASIGRFCILNTNSSLDHDSVMEDFSSLGPGATTGGNCSIGGYSAIAIGAVLLHGIHVGEHAVLGAGSTALKNLDSLKVAYGTPARVVRDRKPGDIYL
jgi:sugar O-acyltransferase (sialic acid O-acetyltransferase NeuD family)